MRKKLSFEDLLMILYSSFLIKKSLGDDTGCDESAKKWNKEGNLGQTDVFPWLGVLRLNYFDGSKHNLAATGIVLVKEKYALANARDIDHLPKAVFKRDAKVFFIGDSDKPWTGSLVDYNVHPEYGISTENSIAILELADFTLVDENVIDVIIPVKPICWPGYAYNTSNELYAVGYTDENELLEKMAYRITYVDLELCKEFYSKVGIEDNDEMSRFICGVAHSNKEHCTWDNGMVLVSNATGVWTMIGFGIQGPSCGGPVRFLDLTSYQTWIDTSTTSQDLPNTYYIDGNEGKNYYDASYP